MSKSLTTWSIGRAGRLDELAAAHAAIGGTGRGRRYALQQINHAYVVMLVAEFQGFCRDLHGEAVDVVVKHVERQAGQGCAAVLRKNLTDGLKLSSGNPNPGNLGADFGRFGFSLIDELEGKSLANRGRLRKLDKELLVWRSAIVHQDFLKPEIVSWGALQLHHVTGWRGACKVLARDCDPVVASRVKALTGTKPW